MYSKIGMFIWALSSTIMVGTAHAANGDKVAAAAQTVEKSLDARVGVAVIDTDVGRVWGYNANDRFPMASTFKVLACAALLSSDAKTKAKSVVIQSGELVTYSPVTEKLVGQDISVLDLCEATLRTSDNTAANKVLDVLGGPAAVTEFLRSLGDQVSRLDRREPDLNEGSPGDERDTTSPMAIASTMQSLVLGNVLDEPDRKKLTSWLIANEVGGPLLRAGVPKDWTLADRTGAGGFGTRGVVAVIWPPKQKPIITAIYITETSASMNDRNKAIAEIGRAIATTLEEQRNK